MIVMIKTSNKELTYLIIKFTGSSNSLKTKIEVSDH